MRCITLTGRAAHGIYLKRLRTMLCVDVPTAGRLAYVSERDLTEMVEREDAIDDVSPEGVRKLGRWSIRRLIPRGPVIYRCDFEFDSDGKLCLVPEKKQSKDLLIWAPDFCNRTDTVLNYPPTKVIAAEDDSFNCLHMMIHLTPGHPLSIYAEGQHAVDGTGPTWRNPLRRTVYEPDAILMHRLHLDQNGNFKH